MANNAAAEVKGAMAKRFDEVLTPEALEFVADLQRRFGPRRTELLAARSKVREQASRTGRLDFLDDTREVREDTSWRVAEPADLVDRRVEITGPTERKMMVNALNSGAKVFMADFEDANTPTWTNMVQGQVNLIDAIERRIDFTTPEGKEYKLKERVAVRLRPVLLPQRQAVAEQGHPAVLLPAEDGAPPRGAALERRVRACPAGARRPGRHDPCHRADRDDPGGVPDGRDPLRAARALLRPERRPV